MSTNRHIDAICAVVTVLTVLLAVLFMNGAALGIEPLTDGDAGTEQFTDNDLDGAWDTANATGIDLTAGTVTGNGAYIVDGDVHIVYAGKYALTGSLADGSVIVEADGDDKIWLLLDGADLHCEDSAALVIEQAEKVFLTLADGTENAISSGSAYNAEAVSASIDGAVYSRDDLTVNGSGALTVTADYQHGIVCNDDLVLAGGTIAVTAAQDGLHANDSVRIANASLTIEAGDDGVTVSNDEQTGYFYMQSGSVTVTSCYEGIEAISVTIDGGSIDITSTDDGINANGAGDISPVITVNGGNVRIVNSQGRDADGMDSNGDILINGGSVFISMTGTGANSAIDYGSENGGVCQINGGTLVACGGASMVESLDTASAQGFVETAASGAAGANLTLTDGSGNILLDATIPNAFTYVMLSAPGMTGGGVYTLSVDGAQTQVTANDTSGASGGFGGMGGMFGGGMQMGGMPMGGGRGGFGGQGQVQMTDQQPATAQDTIPSNNGEAMEPPAMPDSQTAGQPPELPQEEQPQEEAQGLPQEQPQVSGLLPDMQTQGGQQQFTQQRPDRDAQDMSAVSSGTAVLSAETWLLLGVSVLVLLLGLFVAAKFKY